MSTTQTFFVYLVLIIDYLSFEIGQSIICNNAYECVGNQLVASSTDYIYGRGYKSISGMNTSITSEDYVYCYGAFACTESLFVIGKYIRCVGAGSCAN
eukprot:177498_1